VKGRDKLGTDKEERRKSAEKERSPEKIRDTNKERCDERKK
jgi:hypothetical protein